MQYRLPICLRQHLLRRIATLCRPVTADAGRHCSRLSMLKGIRAVLFDVYGTMLTAAYQPASRWERHEAPIRRALQHAGFQCRQSLLAREIANRLRMTIATDHQRRRRAGVMYPEVDIRDIWARVLAILQHDAWIRGRITGAAIQRVAVEYECAVNPVFPTRGLRTILRSLRRHGLILGIISNAQFYTPLMLDAFPKAGPLMPWFDPDLCIWSYRMREVKPSLRLFQDAARRLTRWHHIRPSAVLFVGNDIRHDIRPAKRAGFKTALYAGGHGRTSVEPLKPIGVTPDLVLTQWSQLPACLG